MMGDDKKKKKNGQSMPLAINNIGIGGIVLLGGALVTATLVSIKTRRQRRSSDAINNTKTVDAPNHLENKDRESSQKLPLDLQDSSDGMKEMQAKPNQVLTPDENQNSEKVDSGDGIFSVVGEDLIVFQTQVVDDCEQQSVVATQTEEDSCSEILAITAPRDGGGEEQKYPTLIDDEKTTERSLVSIQGVTLIKEYEAVEVEESMQCENARDITSQIPTGHVVEDQETVFMNACVNQQFLEKKEKDVIIPENCRDLIDQTIYPDSVVNELVMKEEAKIRVEDGLQVQYLEEEKEIDEVEDCEGDLSYKTDEIMRGEKQQMEKNSEQEATGEEEAIKADAQDAQFHEEEKEKDKEGEMPHVQLIEVDDQPEDNHPPRQLMNTEDELVKKEGKSKEDDDVSLIEEAKEGASEVVSSDGTGYSSISMQEEVVPEGKIDNHKTEESMTIVGQDQNDSDRNGIMKQAAATEPWNLKLWAWSLLASIWYICHCYSELPLPQVSLVGSLLFIFISLGYQKRTKY